MTLNGLSTAPVIDIKACGAAGLGSATEDRWIVRFPVTNTDAVAPYRSVVVRDFTLDGPEDGVVGVSLSEEPWPPK
jgi:hypothetical protein